MLRSSLSCSLLHWSASVAFRAGGRPWKLDITSTSPFVLGSLVFAVQVLLEELPQTEFEAE